MLSGAGVSACQPVLLTQDTPGSRARIGESCRNRTSLPVPIYFTAIVVLNEPSVLNELPI
jgi:hypothetical protein